MPKFLRLAFLIIAALAVTACSRDPQVLKKKYLDSGNKYFERAKYKEASIFYRRALAADPKFGEAFLKLAQTALKLGQVASAVNPLRRAVELLPKGSKESNEAYLSLAEILLLAAQSTEVQAQSQPLLDEVASITKGFLQRDPNSYEGHKLSADIALATAIQQYKRNDLVTSKTTLESSIAEYRRTLQIKPGETPVMLSLARTLMLYGETAEAEQLYRQVLDKTPSTGTAYVELYRLYLAQKKLPEGEAVLKRAIAANPKDSNYKTLLAAFYFANNNRAEGARVLEEMKAGFRDYPQAYFTAGDFYLRAGDTAQAVKQYEEGIQKDSARKVDYQKRIIEVLIREGKTAQAYEKNLELLKSNPKDPEARGLKASFLLDKGDVNQAINELQAVVTARPDNFVARFHLGRAHFAKAEYEQARQQFEKAIELRSDYQPARLALAQVSLARGDNENALKYAEDVLRLNPKSGAGRLLASAAQMRLQKFDESRKSLNMILAGNPKQPDTLLELGVLDLMEKKLQEAADSFRMAYDADPTNTRGLLGQAEAFLLMRRPEDALELMRKEVARYPNRSDLKRDMADVQLRTGQFDQAIQTYRTLLPAFKDNARQEGELYARIGATYIQKHDYQDALSAMKQAKELMPDSTPVMNNLALLYENTGNHVEARKVYEQSISKDQNNPEALNNLAYLMAETGGNLDEALTLANRAKQKLPNFAEISDTIGWIYLKKNLSDNAVDIFKDLVAKSPEISTYHYHFAMALMMKGDKANASKQCQLALQNKPNKEEEARIHDLQSKI